MLLLTLIHAILKFMKPVAAWYMYALGQRQIHSLPLLPSDVPSVAQLMSISVGHLNIIQSIATMNTYPTLGIFLLEDVDGYFMKALTFEHQYNALEITCAIFQRWTDGKGRKPITWRTLVKVLRLSQMDMQAEAIEAWSLHADVPKQNTWPLGELVYVSY